MGADTIMMEWKLLMRQVKQVPMEQTHIAWEILREHEEYMIEKGYVINFNEVLSPEGEVLWTRN